MKPEEIAEILNINIYFVNDVLGIKTPEMLRLLAWVREAKTPEELLVLHKRAPYGTRVERLALKRWNSLCLRMIHRTKTCGGIACLYQQIPDGTEAKKLALEKWHVLSLERFRKAKTRKQLIRVFFGSPRGSVAEDLACKKIDRLSLKEVRKAKTREEIVMAFRRAFTDHGESDTQKLCIKKLAALKS